MNFRDNIHKSEVIEKYLNGTLEEGEKNGLEKMLQENASLSQEIEEYRTTFQAINVHALLNDLDEIQHAYHRKEKPEQGKIVSLRKYWKLSVAASFLFFAVAAIQLSMLSKEHVLSDISLYEISFSRGSIDNNKVDSLAKVFDKLYREKSFDACISLYEKESLNENLEIVFLTGNAYLAKEQSKEAMECFHQVFKLNKQNGSDRYNQHAEWYLAVAYLQNEDYDKARSLMDKIRENEHHLFYDQVDFWLYLKVQMLELKS